MRILCDRGKQDFRRASLNAMVSFTSRSLSALALCWVLSAAWGAPENKPRTALVIGNAHYEQGVGALHNTDNDAKAVAQTLRRLGFAVIERHDVTRDQLIRAVGDFRKTLSGAEVALLYYAGHGISVSGANYLIPLKSGFSPGAADEVALRMMAETHLFNAEQAVAEMSAAGARCNLVILDACRNTPLNRTGRTRSVTGHTGLSEMTPPAGSLIAFATDAGQVAFDGDGSNGLYTEELLKNLRTPGLTIEQVFKRTRARVLARSQGGQIPAEYSRLVGDDIYLAGQAAPAPAVTKSPEPTEETVTDPAQLMKLAADGDCPKCIRGLETLSASRGPGDYAVPVFETLLEQVKDDLKQATAPSPKVVIAAGTCAAVLRLLPECLPQDDARANSLAAKAHNRRGDALLLLGRPEEALKEFDSALPLAPTDAYVLFNRGRAHLALDQREEAKADFTAAASNKFDQPGAKRLARQALAEIK